MCRNCRLQQPNPLRFTQLESLFEYYKELENDRLSFIFNENVSDDITDGIIRITEYNVNSFEAFAKLSKRISFIMVECFQNVVRHGVKPEQQEKEKPQVSLQPGC